MNTKKYRSLISIFIMGGIYSQFICACSGYIQGTPDPQNKESSGGQISSTSETVSTVVGQNSSPTAIEQQLTKTPEIEVVSDKGHAMMALNNHYEYAAQMGDSLPVLAKRFNVSTDDIKSQSELPETGLIEPGTTLYIPDKLEETGPEQLLIPDGDIVYSPSALDFDVQEYMNEAGGFMADYYEPRGDTFISGSQIILLESIDYSINPRIILALIEQQSHLISTGAGEDQDVDFLMGWDATRQGFYRQIDYANRVLSTGYYSWREGSLHTLTFPDGSTMNMAPTLNAGSAALQYYFSLQVNQDEWYDKLYGEGNIAKVYENMFGDAWQREASYPPLIPTDLTQPKMELPFQVNRPWNYTSGPHSVWNWYGANAALDFAPSGVIDCSISDEWVTASTAGTVIRTQKGFLAIDLENDGEEQIGWTVIYMHLHTEFPFDIGDQIDVNDFLGYPSCEGGRSTGTHLHIARKYNGEWILADGPVPLVLSGWQAIAGENPYEGQLIKDDETITSSTYGEHYSKIIRLP